MEYCKTDIADSKIIKKKTKRLSKTKGCPTWGPLNVFMPLTAYSNFLVIFFNFIEFDATAVIAIRETK